MADSFVIAPVNRPSIIQANIAIAITLFLILSLWSSAAAAQDLKYFYCYAPNTGTGVIYVSDVHPVGPPAERSNYGSEFAKYMIVKGKLPAEAEGYCVMRARESEIVQGQRDLVNSCFECGGASIVENIAWNRTGKGGGRLLAGDVATPNRKAAVETDDPPKGKGVYLMARIDAVGVAYSANQNDSETTVKSDTIAKGGKWALLLMNDRCPGWVAVAYAETGSDRRYFIQRGGVDADEVSKAAIADASKWIEFKSAEPGKVGIVAVFRNNYVNRDVRFNTEDGLTEGAINYVKGHVRQQVSDMCGKGGPVGRLGYIGVRG